MLAWFRKPCGSRQAACDCRFQHVSTKRTNAYDNARYKMAAPLRFAHAPAKAGAYGHQQFVGAGFSRRVREAQNGEIHETDADAS